MGTRRWLGTRRRRRTRRRLGARRRRRTRRRLGARRPAAASYVTTWTGRFRGSTRRTRQNRRHGCCALDGRGDRSTLWPLPLSPCRRCGAGDLRGVGELERDSRQCGRAGGSEDRRQGRESPSHGRLRIECREGTCCRGNSSCPRMLRHRPRSGPAIPNRTTAPGGQSQGGARLCLGQGACSRGATVARPHGLLPSCTRLPPTHRRLHACTLAPRLHETFHFASSGGSSCRAVALASTRILCIGSEGEPHFFHGRQARGPNTPVPIRTIFEPSSMATRNEFVIPMDRYRMSTLGKARAFSRSYNLLVLRK